MDDSPVVFEQEFFPEDELIYEDLPYTVEKDGDVYVVEGPKIEKCLDTPTWIQRRGLLSSRNS